MAHLYRAHNRSFAQPNPDWCAAALTSGRNPSAYQCRNSPKYGPDKDGHKWCGIHAPFEFKPKVKEQITLWGASFAPGSTQLLLASAEFKLTECRITPLDRDRLPEAFGFGWSYLDRSVLDGSDYGETGIHTVIARSAEQAVERLYELIYAEETRVQLHLVHLGVQRLVLNEWMSPHGED